MTTVAIAFLALATIGALLCVVHNVQRRTARLSAAAYRSGWQTGYDAAEIALRAELNKGARWSR